MKEGKKLFPKLARAVINGTNHSDCVPKEKFCLDTTTLITCLSLMCILGIASNVALLYSDYKEWKKRKTPDKVLIGNIAITNIAALLISLPFQAVHLWKKREHCGKGSEIDMVTQVQKNSLIILTLVSVATFAVLGIDRLDALTKFAHQRRLTVMKAIVASALVWLSALLNLPFLLLYFNIMPLVISIWISISCILIVFSLLLATRRIRKHRQEIIQMFGARRARAEIKFTKTVAALCFIFGVSVLPHLVVSVRNLLDPAEKASFKCVITLSMITVYLSFLLMPIAYFAMDRKMLSSLFPKKVAPSSQIQIPTLQTKSKTSGATVAPATDMSR